MSIIQAIIIAIVEGITEFLPISSTGHMILASVFMDIQNKVFFDTFAVSIQLGAILAIVMIYAKRFLQGPEIYAKLFVAFLPTAVVGFLAHKAIKSLLFTPTVVAVSLVVGGIVLILIDKKVLEQKSSVASLEAIPFKNAFFIGLAQCVAMIPGVSRAAATIVGGVFNGFDKKQAMEFSFLLAVPTMCAATGYDLYKYLKSKGGDLASAFSADEQIALALGLVFAFVTAWLAVKVFLKLVENYGFAFFGYYRIAVGLLFLGLIFGGYLDKID